MSKVQAATHETAARDGSAARGRARGRRGHGVLRDRGRRRGIENLAKAGLSTQDILGGGLTGALDLAAAGELDGR